MSIGKTIVSYRNLTRPFPDVRTLLAKSREARLSDYSGRCTKPLHTTKGILQLCRQRAEQRHVRDLL